MNRQILTTGALAIGGLAMFATALLAQSPTVATPNPSAPQQMTGMQHKMAPDMPAQDARIQALVEKMNAAKGQAKVDAMAELLTAIAQQAAPMRDGMMPMQGQMMEQMMLTKGMSPEMKKMMAECPMMKMMMAMHGK